MQRNWYIEREKVNQIPGLIPMNTYDHASPYPLVPVVSDDKSDYDYIGDPQISEGETLGNDVTPAIHIPP